MALNVVYRKAAETDADVTYDVGGSPEDLTPSLRISKLDSKVTALHGTNTALLTKVAGKILARRKADGQWPNGGGIQS